MNSNRISLTFRTLFFLLLIWSPYACSEGEEPGDVITEETLEMGEELYEEFCLSCHQADGTGVPGLYPPVTRNEWVSGDKKRLIRLTLEGVSGPIEVDGEVYSFEMTGHDFLTDKEISDLLTFLRKSFGNEAGAVLPDEVAEVRSTLGTD